MKTHNILHLSPSAMYHLFMKKVVIMGLTLFFFSCGDTVINTEKSVSDSNDDFKLTLTVSDEIVRLNDSIKLTAFVERKVHKDSIDGYVSMKMIDRKSTRLNSSHALISYAVFCLKKKKKK